MKRTRSGAIDITKETENTTVEEGLAIAANTGMGKMKTPVHPRIAKIKQEDEVLAGIIQAATFAKIGEENNNNRRKI